MHVTARLSQSIAAPPERVFDVCGDLARWPSIFVAYGPIPGVISAAMKSGSSAAVGAQRELGMSDGSRVVEEILAYDRPRRHGYRWAPPGPPLSLILRSATAEWRFQANERGETACVWSYQFELTSGLVYPLGLLIRALFARWMARAMLGLTLAAEAP